MTNQNIVRHPTKGMPMTFAPTCDYPNCMEPMEHGVAGTYPGDVEPSQWCDKHYKYVMAKCKKDPSWIRKFQSRQIKGLPKDKRKIRVYAW